MKIYIPVLLLLFYLCSGFYPGSPSIYNTGSMPIAKTDTGEPYWSITGNTGINANNNFIGTIDNSALVFRSFNQRAGYLTPGINGNIAFGLSGIHPDSGFSNIAIGNRVMMLNKKGSDNVGIGADALLLNSNGAENTAVGSFTLSSNTAGGENTAIGSYSLNKNTTGVLNTAIGYSALRSALAGSFNSALGIFALNSLNTGSSNSAFGAQSLQYGTNGSGMTAFGAAALQNNNTDNNSAFGTLSLATNVNGIELCAFGYKSLYQNTGNYNSAFGYQALLNNTTGFSNFAAGDKALDANTTGSINNAVGNNALGNNTTGSNNTAMGADGLLNNTTGTGNTSLGFAANTSLGNLSNASAIGYNAIANASNKVSIGNTLVTVIGGQVGWSTFSDGRFKENIKEDVPGLNFITRLRPVTYTVNIGKLNNHLRRNISVDNTGGMAISPANETVHTGFIAQEVEELSKKMNWHFDGVNPPSNATDNYSINYSQFVMPLVKAVQELNAKNQALQQQLENMKTEIKALQNTTPCPASITIK